MGKSPGKWIKALIFGKKSSKSSSRKKSAMPEKDEAVSSKTPTFGCDNALCNANIGTGESSDKAKNVSLRNEIFPFSQPEEKQTATDQQELAAITAQAILRGYLARRCSFRAVKGIVRLQALVRGLLVRRQAVSTLRCAQGIVRLQALSRGGKVRASDIGREVQKKLGSRDISGFSTTPRQDKLSSNAFACKHLASSRTAIPLRFCYDPTVPNSAQQWLERWSSSKFWGPIPQSKKKKKDYTDKKTPRKKSNNLRIKKTDLTRLKQVEERVSNLTNNRKLLSELIREKHTTSPRNSEAKEPEKPSNELERVKQNLRRISASSKVALINSSHSQPLVETPKPVVPQKGDDKTEDKTDDNKPNEDIVAVERSDLSENVEKIIEDVSKIDETTQRSDLPRKLEFAENVSQRSPVVVPNYMTATKSAKAKLRGFGSPRSDRDEPDVSDGGLLRRHSLPYGKSSLMISPRPEKILATGENRPLLSSADGYVSGKATSRPGWRR